MKSIIKNNIIDLKYKDISNQDVIRNYKETKNIQITTNIDKLEKNKNFAKSNAEINKSYKEKVIDNKKNLLKESIKTNANNNQYDNSSGSQKNIENINNSDIKQDNHKTKKNNRHYISRRILRETEKGIDELLDTDDDDFGIDTIRKSKAGIKGIGIISSRAININKGLGKKAYNIITSEEAKEVYNTARTTTKKVYNTSKDFATKVYIKNKVSQITKNTDFLKQKQKKDILKKAKQKAKQKTEQIIAFIGNKTKTAIVEIFSQKIAITTLIILMLLLTIVSTIIGITSIFSYSVNLALDDSASLIYEYVSELDNKINMQIDFAETNYSGFDEYIYNVSKRAGTNPEQVYAFLKAKYGDSKLSEEAIKLEIEQIHNKLYNISFVETSTSNTITQEDGTEVIETKKIMTITLVTKTFAEYYEENKNVLLSEEQQKDYEEILKLIQENVGKVLLNPFPRERLEIICYF